MRKKSDVTRRDFLKTTGKTTASLAVLGGATLLTHPEKVFGANDRVRIAVCGLRSRGKDHLHRFSHVPNVEIAALCDGDQDILSKSRGEVSGNAQTFVDVRELLQDKSIDAISIAA